MNTSSRRNFIKAVGAATAMALPGIPGGAAELAGRTPGSKPIAGSWISILWNDRRHFYWNDTCAKFTAQQWDDAVKEMSEIGMEYLVLLTVANGGKAFYDTPLLPKAKELVCENPIEALLSAADKYGVKFFLSCDLFGDWPTAATLNEPETVRARLQMMEEVAKQYAHHESFYGWYWSIEAYLTPYFVPAFVEYINTCSREARKLTPKAKMLDGAVLYSQGGERRSICQTVRRTRRGHHRLSGRGGLFENDSRAERPGVCHVACRT